MPWGTSGAVRRCQDGQRVVALPRTTTRSVLLLLLRVTSRDADEVMDEVPPGARDPDPSTKRPFPMGIVPDLLKANCSAGDPRPWVGSWRGRRSATRANGPLGARPKGPKSRPLRRPAARPGGR